MTWIQQLIRIGVDDDTPRGTARTVKLTNGFTLFCLLFALVSVPVNLSHGHPAWELWALLQAVCAASMLLALLLNAQRRYFAAVSCLLSLLLLYFVVGTVVLGRGIGLHWLAAVFPVFPFLLYPKPHSISAFVLAIIGVGTCVVLELGARDGPLIGEAYSSQLESNLLHLRLLNLAALVAFIGYLCRRTTLEAEARLEEERDRSDSLLLNILPEPIAARLKESPSSIADGHDEITVLFADIANFTPMSEELSPGDLVALLNRVFTRIDHVMQKHGIEKIKTIGDAYMAAAGVPVRYSEHAERMADAALEVSTAMESFVGPRGERISLRMGISTGPAVAGVIGVHKFAYDLWGDKVNTASRMESHGETGRIQVTDATYELLEETHLFRERGPVDVKGKGVMKTWWLLGKR